MFGQTLFLGGRSGPDVSTLLSGLNSYYALESNFVDSISASNGTGTSMAFASGKIDQSADFGNGVGRVTISGTGPKVTGAVSVSAWVYPIFFNGDRIIFACDDVRYPSTYAGYTLQVLSTNQFQFLIANGINFIQGSGYQSVVTTSSFTLNTWHHLVGTFDGSTIRIYLNGALEGSIAWAGGLAYDGTTNITMGMQQQSIFGGSYAPGALWNGRIDEVGIWNRALTPTEVSTLYNGGAGVSSSMFILAPSVTSIAPNTGYNISNTPVTISGSSFVPGSTVSIGGNPCTAITFVNGNTITATTPVGIIGPADVVVTNPDGRSSTLTSGFTYQAYPLTTNLVGYWPLNGNANDAYNTNHGTATNITYDSAKILTGAQGDGLSSIISLPNLNVSGSSPRTVAMWVKKGASNTIKTLWGCGVSTYIPITDNLKNFNIHVNAVSAGDVYVAFNNADLYTSNNKVSSTDFTHIAVTYNGGAINNTNVKIYVNGVSQSLSSTGAALGNVAATVNSNYAIGMDVGGSGRNFDGIIDDVGFWNRELSASDIAVLYNSGYGRSYPFDSTFSLLTGLERWYPLDGNSTDVHSGLNGTITGPSPAYEAGQGQTNALYLGANNSNLFQANAFRPTEFSVAFQVYSRNGVVGNYCGVVGNFSPGAVTSNWCFLGGANQAQLYYDNNAASPLSATLGNGSWSHVVLTRTAAGVVKIYTNGSLTNTTSGANTTAFQSGDKLYIASRPDGYSVTDARMQNVGLWNRPLSDAEVTALYNSGNPLKYGDLVPLASGVIANWDLENNLTDSLGVSSGTGTGISYSGSYTDFGAGVGRVTLPNGALQPSTVSVSAWFYSTQSSQYANIIAVNKSAYPDYYAGWGLLQDNTSRMSFAVGDNTSGWSLASANSSALTINTWHHVVGTYDGATIKMYLDGVLVNSVPWTHGIGYGTDIRARIGYERSTPYGVEGDGNPWNGRLKWITVWNRALNDGEAAQLWNSGIGLPYRSF